MKLKEWCELNNRLDILEEWDVQNNEFNDITPDITHGSTKKVFWICKRCGNGWKDTPNNRTIRHACCPACANTIKQERRMAAFIKKNGSLASNCPELLKEWDYDKNIGLDPERITKKSSQKVWWRCPDHNHSYQSTIDHRTSEKPTGCPYCHNKKVITGDNDFATNNPHLLKEWDFEKNTNIDPCKITKAAAKVVWWKCGYCNHSWKAIITQRIAGTGCPRCAKQFQTSYPEQVIFYYVKQYFPDAINNERTVLDGKELDIFIPSIQTAIEYDGKAFHSVKRDVKKNKMCVNQGIRLIRVREKGAEAINEDDSVTVLEYTYGKVKELDEIIYKVFSLISDIIPDVDISRDASSIYEQYMTIKKEYNLATQFPDVAAEWNYQKNGLLKPQLFNPGTRQSVWWKCNNGHEWFASIGSRTGTLKPGCPICSNKLVQTGVNDFATERPDLLSEWDIKKNKILPSELTRGSGIPVWWLCPVGHSYQMSPHKRIKQNCPFCSSQRIKQGYNDLASLNPALAAQWNREKNGETTPNSVFANSNKKYWWKCEKGHEWQAQVGSRNKGVGCPICSNHQLLVGYNDFATVHPELLKEWDYEKNDIQPNSFCVSSQRKVWWCCSNCSSRYQAVTTSKKTNTCKYCCNSKSVKNIETGRIFPTITDAAKYYGLKDNTGISKCLSGARISAGGYHWEYDNSNHQIAVDELLDNNRN